ncbi:VOC family protein [Enterococcus raffinosus]|uniref:VOC family protein n=1 Tax=Enterococcus raffinosus TaxID=71452 RepID=UPI001C4506A9|nr:VOC family protein [Enterococcus raffinosus]QXJ58299.1 VOC family protein [Enterococcus raffinosus]
MEQQFSCCLWFDGQLAEAADFYMKTFEDSKKKNETHFISNEHGTIGDLLTVTLELAGTEFLLLNGGPDFEPTPAISYVVNCENEKQLNDVWKQLNQSGETLMALTDYPELGKFGWTNDRYGVSWQVRLGESLQTIIPCIMFANKNYGLAQAAIDEWITTFGGKQTFVIKGKDDRLRASGFQLRGHDLIIMDSPEKHAFDFSMGNSFYFYFNDQADIDHVWNLITKNGKEWPCGWMEDRYGVSWQTVNKDLLAWTNDSNLEKARRATEEMYKMKKIDLARIKRAHDGIL